MSERRQIKCACCGTTEFYKAYRYRYPIFIKSQNRIVEFDGVLCDDCVKDLKSPPDVLLECARAIRYECYRNERCVDGCAFYDEAEDDCILRGSIEGLKPPSDWDVDRFVVEDG